MAKKRVKKHVSDQLRDAIRGSGESLCRIAGGSGVNDGILSRYMRGLRGLSTKSVDRLCEYLELELRESKRKGR